MSKLDALQIPMEWASQFEGEYPKTQVVWDSEPIYSSLIDPSIRPKSGTILGAVQTVFARTLLGKIESVKIPRLETIHRTIDLGDWEASLSYGDVERKDLAKKLLADFDIERSEGNVDWLETVYTGIISTYERKYGVSLSGTQREMLKGFAMQAAYDLLHVT